MFNVAFCKLCHLYLCFTDQTEVVEDMARLLQPPPKFTHPEWVISNQTKYASAEGERAAAERLVMEADRVINETDKTTFKVQRDVNKKFGA